MSTSAYDEKETETSDLIAKLMAIHALGGNFKCLAEAVQGQKAGTDEAKLAADLMERWNFVEKLNQATPDPRPQKPRHLAVLGMMQKRSEADKKKAQGLQFASKQILINGKSRCSVTPLIELKPITLGEMQVPFVHTGSVLACRVITKAFAVNVGTMALIEDINGDVETVSFFNFSTDIGDPDWLHSGAILLIKEPYLKYASLSRSEETKCAVLRIDSPSDVVFVPVSDHQLLKSVGAECWHEPEIYTSDGLKRRGNELFAAKNYTGSLDFYNRALAVLGASPKGDESEKKGAVLCLNLAAAHLAMEHFEEAGEAAKKALEEGADKGKSFFRLGKAAYGLNRWADAIDHFEAALAENPTEESKNSILGELERAHARLSEASTGVYDLASIVDRCCRCPDSEQHPIRFDLANYTRLVRVTDIPGKDKGLVVSGGPVKKGTLLFAEKAYAVGLPCMDLACMNWVTMEPSYASQVDCIIETVQKLCREPSSATELYSLWAGAGTRHQHGIGPPSTAIDIGRIESICSYNAFGVLSLFGSGQSKEMTAEGPLQQDLGGVTKLPAALWLLASFMNHACLPNTHRVHCGDMMFVYALEDLKEGAELTTPYTTASTKRSKSLTKKWGFICACRLCELDERLGKAKAEQLQKLETKSDEIRSKLLIDGSQQQAGHLLGSTRTLVEQMRSVYGTGRPLFRLSLQQPLFVLSVLHSIHGHEAAAAQVLEEIVSDCLTPPFAYIDGPTVHILLVSRHLAAGNRRLAQKWAAEAFEVARVGYGVTSPDLFMRLYGGHSTFRSIPGLDAKFVELLRSDKKRKQKKYRKH